MDNNLKCETESTPGSRSPNFLLVEKARNNGIITISDLRRLYSEFKRWTNEKLVEDLKAAGMKPVFYFNPETDREELWHGEMSFPPLVREDLVDGSVVVLGQEEFNKCLEKILFLARPEPIAL